MAALVVQVGSTITNGASALRITERVDKCPGWGTPGWRGLNIALEQFGGNTGTASFVPDYLLSGWRHVPFEWSPCVGAAVEERYVWSPDFSRLVREVRRSTMPTVDGIRGHRVATAAEDELRRAHTLALAGHITPKAVQQILREVQP